MNGQHRTEAEPGVLFDGGLSRRIEKKTSLSDGEKAAVKALEAEAYRADGLENGAFLENELNFDRTVPCFYLGYQGERLAAFLTAFFPDREDGEMVAFTHPGDRRKGWFSTLYREAAGELRAAGVGRTVFAVEPKSRSGMAVLKRFPQAQWLRSEYRMEHPPEAVSPLADGLTVTPLSQETKAAYCAISTKAFGDGEGGIADSVMQSRTRRGFLLYEGETPVGVYDLDLEDTRVFLYGVAVKEEQRNRGYGREIVHCALREGEKRGVPVVLDVDSGNPPALHLYRSCGFRDTFQVDYFSCPFGELETR